MFKKTYNNSLLLTLTERFSITGGCRHWFTNPIPELQPAFRFAYNHVNYTKIDKTGEHVRQPLNSTKYANLISVPYPSSVHFSSDTNLSNLPQFDISRKRNHLMSFVGSGKTKTRHKRHAVI